jgi:hypothetical protein
MFPLDVGSRQMFANGEFRAIGYCLFGLLCYYLIKNQGSSESLKLTNN